MIKRLMKETTIFFMVFLIPGHYFFFGGLALAGSLAPADMCVSGRANLMCVALAAARAAKVSGGAGTSSFQSDTSN